MGDSRGRLLHLSFRSNRPNAGAGQDRAPQPVRVRRVAGRPLDLRARPRARPGHHPRRRGGPLGSRQAAGRPKAQPGSVGHDQVVDELEPTRGAAPWIRLAAATSSGLGEGEFQGGRDGCGLGGADAGPPSELFGGPPGPGWRAFRARPGPRAPSASSRGRSCSGRSQMRTVMVGWGSEEQRTRCLRHPGVGVDRYQARGVASSRYRTYVRTRWQPPLDSCTSTSGPSSR